MGFTHPALQDTREMTPFAQVAWALGSTACTPQLPQLVVLVRRSTSQPSEGSELQSP
jgi:hypothetical protein